MVGVSIVEEPFQKLVNQGMIQGRVIFVTVSKTAISSFPESEGSVRHYPTPCGCKYRINDILDLEAFKAWRPEFANAEFILEDGKYICGWAVENE